MYRFQASNFWRKKLSEFNNEELEDLYPKARRVLKDVKGSFSEQDLAMLVFECDYFFSDKVKEHRYLNSKNLISNVVNMGVDISNLTDVSPRFFHFEKGCFFVDSVEILGAFFFVSSGRIYINCSVKICELNHQSSFVMTGEQFYDDLEIKNDVDRIMLDPLRAAAKVCFGLCLLESAGKCFPKDGLWRKKFKHPSRASVIQFVEPRNKMRWHFRQLRHERYYRGDYSDLEVGSRWVFVCPEENENDIKTILK